MFFKISYDKKDNYIFIGLSKNTIKKEFIDGDEEEKKVILPFIPADVPDCVSEIYGNNIAAITRNTGRLFMFAADQKIEHLNDDFYGPGIDKAANHPEYVFKIACDGSIGALAVHAGLIARYGRTYNALNYIVKLNGRTNRGDCAVSGPLSSQMWDIDDVLYLASEYNLNIRGIGYTIYLGSENESYMLSQAAQVVLQAHKEGLVAILWIYPRAKHIKDGATPELVAGAAGLGNALGADFVKVQMPHAHVKLSSIEALRVATEAAGNTGLIVSGGGLIPIQEILKNIAEQLALGGTSGCAIGRNIFQRSYGDAVVLSRAVSALVYDGATYQESLEIVKKNI